MKDNTNNPLVISEIAGLWNSYMNETMAICTLKYFLNNVEDKKIKDLLQKFLSLSEEHLKKLKHFYHKEKLPIPQGFTENDVDTNAPRLFTDTYYLFYLFTMVSFGMDSYSLVIRYSPRSDIRKYFSECLIESLNLTNETMDVLLTKGLFIKPPRFEVSKEISFIEKEKFLSGIFGTPRPLLAREATNAFSGIFIDIMIKGLIVGFGQTTRTKEVRDYMFKGRDFISKHYDKFTLLLSKEQIPVPSGYDTFVTSSTIPTFSEKLMMYHTFTMCAFGLAVDGAAIATSMRTDLTSLHTIFGAEISKFMAEGATLMINNGWMEQPPQVVRHEELVHS